MLNEAAGLPRVLRSLAALEPPPAEVLAVDGGSTDASVAIAEAAGLLVVRHETGTGVLLAALAVLAHHLSGRRSAA
jgi:glycosyltransferase involved in cell wall biosynthesis